MGSAPDMCSPSVHRCVRATRTNRTFANALCFSYITAQTSLREAFSTVATGLPRDVIEESFRLIVQCTVESDLQSLKEELAHVRAESKRFAAKR
jgi:hypothetical protein